MSRFNYPDWFVWLALVVYAVLIVLGGGAMLWILYQIGYWLFHLTMW